MSNLMNFSGTVLKNLFSKPVTKNYPAEPIDYPERSRGHIENDFEQCILCGLCMRNCPTGAIVVEKAKGDWRINRFDCVQCGYCTIKCPKKCLHLLPGYQEPMGEKTEEVQHRDVPPAPPKPAAKPTGDVSAAKPSGDAAAKAAGDAASANSAESSPAASGDGYPQADLEKCVFCTLCAKKCPQSALTVDRAEKKWELDKEACIQCGLCAENCPKKCIAM